LSSVCQRASRGPVAGRLAGKGTRRGVCPLEADPVKSKQTGIRSPVATRLRPYVYSSVNRVLIYRGKFRVGEMWVHKSAEALLDL